MRVRATQRGYLGSLREKGDVFEVDKAGFTDVWMEPVDEPKAEKPAKGGKADEPKAE